MKEEIPGNEFKFEIKLLYFRAVPILGNGNIPNLGIQKFVVFSQIVRLLIPTKKLPPNRKTAFCILILLVSDTHSVNFPHQLFRIKISYLFQNIDVLVFGRKHYFCAVPVYIDRDILQDFNHFCFIL